MRIGMIVHVVPDRREGTACRPAIITRVHAKGDRMQAAHKLYTAVDLLVFGQMGVYPRLRVRWAPGPTGGLPPAHGTWHDSDDCGEG